MAIFPNFLKFPLTKEKICERDGIFGWVLCWRDVRQIRDLEATISRNVAMVRMGRPTCVHWIRYAMAGSASGRMMRTVGRWGMRV